MPLVIHACGLKPVFVDVDPDTYNMKAAEIEAHITPRTRAILATHMYGQPCDMEPILEIAGANDLKVLEDCAHALGAEYNGKKVGSFGDLGLFTFAMAKNMPCFGGGMITTSDEELHQRLTELISAPELSRHKSLWKEVASTTVNHWATLPKVFRWFTYPVMRALAAANMRVFDKEPGQENVSQTEVSTKYFTRLTNLQAAVGLRQLRRLVGINSRVNRNALLYNEELKGVANIKTPQTSSGRTHTFLYYRLEVDSRKVLREKLFDMGVDTVADDMSDCTTLAPFKDQDWDIPVARRLPHRILEIPNNYRLKEGDVRHIAECIRNASLG